MDIWTKLFLVGGAMLGAMFFLVALITLSNAENGLLTVESVSHLEVAMVSFYDLMKWIVMAWMGVAIVVFVRFLGRFFGKK